MYFTNDRDMHLVTFGDSGYYIDLTLRIDNDNIFLITNLFQIFFVDGQKIFLTQCFYRPIPLEPMVSMGCYKLRKAKAGEREGFTLALHQGRMRYSGGCQKYFYAIY